VTEFHAGDIVAGYRLEARLGGGGYGTVWRARRVDSGRVVAIKLLPELTDGDEDTRGAAEAELLAASAARTSPHVVQVLDGGTEPVPFVVMELVAGTSLSEELRQRQRLSQQETIEIGLGIAEALRVLNEVGIVHRDVKPSNVMIDRDGVVKLTDFGIAKIAGFDNRTQTGDLRLSIAYAAPEVWEGHAEHSSDLYALAIVLYQCLSGQLPFRGGYAELFYQHRSAEPDLSALPPDLAPSLLRLISACLAKDPDDRLPDAAACVGLLNLAKQEAPVAETAAPPAREPARFGPWTKLEAIGGLPWTWRCRHERTGEEAEVELRFATAPDEGEALRRAVAANPRFVALGGQRLLQTNRLILRPGEAWTDPPPSAFQFWLAAAPNHRQAEPAQVDARALLRIVESLNGMIGVARMEGLPLDLGPDRVDLTSGAALVLAPGVPGDSTTDVEEQALARLRELPLGHDTRQIVEGHSRLDELQRALAVLVSVRAPASREDAPAGPAPTRRAVAPAAAPPGRNGRRRPLLIAAGLATVLAAVGAAAVLIATSGGGTREPPSIVGGEDPSPTQPAELVACLGLSLPASLNEADAACGGIPSAFVFDASCQRGFACRRDGDKLDTIKVGRNTQTHAFIDPDGRLRLTAEAGGDATLTTDGAAREPVWSPDGRYLAYVHVQEIAAPQVPTPAQGQPPSSPPVARYSTQLRVVEAGRPANDGIVFATNDSDSVQPWLRRHVSSPQWSPDGRALYFRWTDPASGEAGLYRVELPVTGARIDFGRLRGGAPATEVILPGQPLASVMLGASDFGVAGGRLGDFSVLRDGSIHAQVCDGSDATLRCGLGRWSGQASLLRPLEDGVIYGVPRATGDGVLYASVKRGGEGWRLLKISLTGGAAADVAGVVIGAPEEALSQTPPTPRFALERSGETFIVETVTGQLARVSLTEGGAPFAAGGAPVVYVGAGMAPAGPPPRAVPFQTPTPTPSPTPTPTVTPTPVPNVRPMSLLLSVRSGSSPLANAAVVAFIDNDECASGRTDSGGGLFLFIPRDGAPARCSAADATYRFRVNGTVVPNASIRYTPQGNFPLELVVPQ
jgi:hypothetical protein